MSATSATAATAPIQHVRIGDHEIAYREIGSGRPLVLLQRFRGTIDHWDPQFLDALATRRRVVTFDAPGVGGSTGAVPQTISGMASDAAEFAAALDLGRADWLGWSMGGMVAQAVAILHQDQVRRLVLDGTCPPGNPNFVPPSDAWRDVAIKPEYDLEDVVALFYTDSAESRRAAAESEQRLASRTDRVPEVAQEAWGQQAQAIFGFYADQESLFARLRDITVPVLVGAGDHDRAFPLINQAVFAQEIPDVRVVVYPDSGHGFQFQYLEHFTSLVDTFLD